jgi:hypothetical protein
MLSRTGAPASRQRTVSSQHDGSGCLSCIRYDWDDECGLKIGESSAAPREDDVVVHSAATATRSARSLPKLNVPPTSDPLLLGA